MATKSSTHNAELNRKVKGEKSSLPALALLAGWLVPGAGYLITGKWVRAALVAVSVVAMFAIGLGMQAKIYQPNTGDVLDILGFAGQLGLGLLYVASRIFDLGHATMTTTINDYGTKFLVAAGLLNLMAAVDAHSLANGRKVFVFVEATPESVKVPLDA